MSKPEIIAFLLAYDQQIEDRSDTEVKSKNAFARFIGIRVNVAM